MSLAHLVPDARSKVDHTKIVTVVDVSFEIIIIIIIYAENFNLICCCTCREEVM